MWAVWGALDIVTVVEHILINYVQTEIDKNEYLIRGNCVCVRLPITEFLFDASSN